MTGLTPDGGVHTPGGHVLPPSALTWRYSRSSGPGGQHVNTADTRVEAVLDVPAAGLPPTVTARILDRLGEQVRVVEGGSRSQTRNRRAVAQRLGDLVDEAARPRRARRPTRPHPAAVDRRLDAKRHQAARKAERGWRPGGEV